ncbi:helix-turn-helix transcriptional regulator [Halorientalis pallida]|uniref:helix-turn-helix transcriptional regulator n=1 Tax=Halorientalis pallida TaxID=2479928 RepID=UPI001D0FB1E1|nr:helix-turn-helix domain-containing protein [Halorientalis pallida]
MAPVLTVASARPALLVGSLLVVVLLGGVLALATIRARTTTDPAETDDEDAPAHPDAWRIRRLLDEHGGRLPQSEIVERTGWSKSKVSRVLSAMAEDEQVRKIRIGRENLVTRPGDVPEHASSPFDDETPKG